VKIRILTAALALSALALTGCNSGTSSGSKPSHTAHRAATAQPVEETTAPEYVTPTADDFEITLKTTHRQCFGSAGCNVTVEPDLTYAGTVVSLDPAITYDITYEITGDESGPVVNTLTLSAGTSIRYTPSDLSTASSYTKVSVKITDVSQAG
jgi:predicted small secreted protein